MAWVEFSIHINLWCQGQGEHSQKKLKQPYGLYTLTSQAPVCTLRGVTNRGVHTPVMASCSCSWVVTHVRRTRKDDLQA